MENNHPVLSKMNEYIKDLEEQASGLNRDNLRISTFWDDRTENIRMILVDALSEEQSEHVTVKTLANSIADVLGISLLREISVTFNVAVEATMLVPADFDVSDFDVTDVRMEAWNSEVEDFSVESFEISDVEQS